MILAHASTSLCRYDSSNVSDDDRPRKQARTQSQGLMPWSTRSTNAAGCRSLMYGDLAEVPATRLRRSCSRTGGSKSSRGPEYKPSLVSSDRQLGATADFSKSPEPKANYDASRSAEQNEKGRISRAEWEFMWSQYQQLSRTLQEALKQRTAELA